MVVIKYIKSVEKFDVVILLKVMFIFFRITYQMYYFYENKKIFLDLKFQLYYQQFRTLFLA